MLAIIIFLIKSLFFVEKSHSLKGSLKRNCGYETPLESPPRPTVSHPTVHIIDAL